MFTVSNWSLTLLPTTTRARILKRTPTHNCSDITPTTFRIVFCSGLFRPQLWESEPFRSSMLLLWWSPLNTGLVVGLLICRRLYCTGHTSTTMLEDEISHFFRPLDKNSACDNKADDEDSIRCLNGQQTCRSIRYYI